MVGAKFNGQASLSIETSNEISAFFERVLLVLLVKATILTLRLFLNSLRYIEV